MSLIEEYVKLAAKEEKLAVARSKDTLLSSGPSARFMRRVEFDGSAHYYDSRTHTVERLCGTGKIRKANTQKARKEKWVVGSPFKGNGLRGMYARFDCYVVRPKTKEELAEDLAAREARKSKLQGRRALPWEIRRLLAHSGFAGRKQVLRTNAGWAEKIIPGYKYESSAFVVGADVVEHVTGRSTRLLIERDPAQGSIRFGDFSWGGAWAHLPRRDAQHFGEEAAAKLVEKLSPTIGREIVRPAFKWCCEFGGEAIVASSKYTLAGVWFDSAYDLSPYGPRTRNLLSLLGVPAEKHEGVLQLGGFSWQ